MSNKYSSAAGTIEFVLLAAMAALLVTSAAVAVPLLWRGFYYLHVDALHLTETTPWSYEEICTAYDEMMDFCMTGADFSTGVLKWSEEGMQHFADCRVLFMLDIRVLVVSAVLTMAFTALTLSNAVDAKPPRPLGHGPLCWGGLFPAALLLIVAALTALVGFDKAFVTFHHMFFSGKSNWLFDPRLDEIINVLPEVFFMDCAILIAVCTVVFGIIAAVLDWKLFRQYK